ncbi:M13 family peptidase [Klebsormidium nitens]|uniref:M13 family peptidase n=1 Tax=Klebsormidium nitens TaxID=105231 RepID=A0A1Y1HUV6_KLENI|nr:M13 family peptidase [Klebsormidium nitens]|eukprot:GAQ80969.1 M13 family peptidase [Klebsormidium nitens]
MPMAPAEDEFKAIDPANLDRSVSPGDDFFSFANGTWCKSNPIPSDYSRWGAFEVMNEKNLAMLKKIVDDAMQDTSATGTVQKVGTFWRSAVDTEGIEAAALTPLADWFKAIEQGGNRSRIVAQLHRKGIRPLFTLVDSADSKNSGQSIAHLYQGGLGLPDRDFYVLPEKEEIRGKYKDHLTAVFKLLGKSDEEAKASSVAVFSFEKRLAEASLTKVERRDPERVYNKRTWEEAQSAAAPGFDLGEYFRTVGKEVVEVNLEHPDFFNAVGRHLADLSDADWKAYLTWNVVHSLSEYLPEAFVRADFEFYKKVLDGQQDDKPRWKKMLGLLDWAVGEALGELYVHQVFSPEAKQRALVIVGVIQETMEERLKTLAWMKDETKKRALEKLGTFKVKIGYPDQWIDYGPLVVRDEPLVGNVLRAKEFHFERMLDRLDKPVDRTRWMMTPQTVNAYYHPKLNEIVFPAAILQFPFFDPRSDDAVNYGAMGGVIAHEITHGYDDQGRRFDATGNLADWWTPEDAEEFKRRAKVIVDQFSDYAVHGAKLNGELTQGENIADLGGVKIAYAAFQRAQKKQKQAGDDVATVNPGGEFTPAQRFFLSWAQVWRSNITKEQALKRVTTDPHSPADYRVNGIVCNVPEFYEAFGVKEGDNLFRSNSARVDIW